MFRTLIVTAALMSTVSISARAATVDCPRNYPNGSTMTYSDGAMNFPTGATLRYSSGAMNYPSGATFRYSSGSMNYPTGATLRYSNGSMNYPSGATLRYSDGALNNANGTTNQSGSVIVNSMFGDSQMRIKVRPHSETYTFTLPYGNDVAEVTLDQDGNVTCTVDQTDNPETEFKLTGSRGSAFVKVAPGQDARAVRDAVQRALDGE